LARAVAATFRNAGRATAITRRVVAVVALLQAFLIAIAAEGLGLTGVRAAIPASGIAIVAHLCVVRDAITAAFDAAVGAAAVTIDRVVIVALLGAFQTPVTARWGLNRAALRATITVVQRRARIPAAAVIARFAAAGLHDAVTAHLGVAGGGAIVARGVVAVVASFTSTGLDDVVTAELEHTERATSVAGLRSTHSTVALRIAGAYGVGSRTADAPATIVTLLVALTHTVSADGLRLAAAAAAIATAGVAIVALLAEVHTAVTAFFLQAIPSTAIAHRRIAVIAFLAGVEQIIAATRQQTAVSAAIGVD
jgi:hypothetical protein